MRFLAIVSIVTVLAVTTSAQAPGAKPKPAPPAGAKPAAPAAQATGGKTIGNLAQVMRGILFPNANILFDVQSKDPETFGKKQEGGDASSTFSGIYTGWQVVENAAIALNESARLLEVPGRLCQNGKPVPIAQKDWAPFVADLRKASAAMLKAAQSKNKELASDTTNDVAGACENCHSVYRDADPRCTPK
jgi:hypothetical protein